MATDKLDKPAKITMDILWEELQKLSTSSVERINILEQDLKTLRSELQENLHEIKEEIKNCCQITNKVSNLETEIEILQKNNSELKSKNSKLKERIVQLDYAMKSRNLVFYGIKENEQNSVDQIQDILTHIFQDVSIETEIKHREIQIDQAYRLGKQKQNYNRPLLLKLVKTSDKSLLLQHRHNLPRGIYMEEDFPIEIQQKRQIIRPVYLRLKKIPSLRGRVSMKYDKLIVDGKVYDEDQLHILTEHYTIPSLCEKSDEKTLVFFGQHSMFSNFYDSSFVHDGIFYKTSEHAIQYSKAIISEDYSTGTKILKCSTPREAKRLGKNINNFIHSKWTKEGLQMCYPLIKAKFTQNEELKEKLLSTGTKLLAESSKDKLWGTGITLSDHRALNKQEWINNGWMHTILTRIRSELQ